MFNYPCRALLRSNAHILFFYPTLRAHKNATEAQDTYSGGAVLKRIVLRHHSTRSNTIRDLWIECLYKGREDCGNKMGMGG